ncbi:MAG: hypothetical protein ACN4GF_01645 [Lentimonas sp.]
MKNLSLILRILAIVAAVAAAGIFFAVQGKLTEKQAQLESSQSATVAVQAELDSANAEVSALTSNLNVERAAVAKAKSENETLSSEMYTARKEVTRTQQQLRESKKEIETMAEAAKGLRADLFATEQSLAEASKEGEIAQLNERIKELEGANSSLTSDLQSAKAISSARASNPDSTAPSTTAGGLPTVNYPTNNAPAVEAASIGTETSIASISAVNGLIVLDSTPELALTPGTEVTLVQNLKALGKVVIVSNQNNLALANILPGAKTRQLIPGTTVSLLR